MNWREIAVTAFITPFKEWQLCLQCAALPAGIYAVLMLGLTTFSPEEPTILAQMGIQLSEFLWIGPIVMFSGSWMAGLWHGPGPSKNWRSHRRFWLHYLALFCLVELLWLLSESLPDLLSIWFGAETGATPSEDAFATYKTAQSRIFWKQIIDVGLKVFSAWVAARLVSWQAMAIDYLEVTGPRATWSLTRGHAWRIFWIDVLVSLPFVAIILGVYFQAPQLFDEPVVFWFMMPLFLLYSQAVHDAASLLIYSHLTQRRVDPSIDVF